MSGFLGWFRRATPAERLSRFGLRPDVVAAAQTMASYRSTEPQIVALPTSLTPNEQVLRMMDGEQNGARGLLVLTDERVFFRPRDSDGPVSFSVRLPDIQTIEGSTHRVVGTVRITSSAGTYVVGDILGTQGEMLADEARDAMLGLVRPPRDPLAMLRELRELREHGKISDSEFEARKSELWGEI